MVKALSTKALTNNRTKYDCHEWSVGENFLENSVDRVVRLIAVSVCQQGAIW
jgi:hypothetical protein